MVWTSISQTAGVMTMVLMTAIPTLNVCDISLSYLCKQPAILFHTLIFLQSEVTGVRSKVSHTSVA